MSQKIISARLDQYSLHTLEDEENALKEILQEVALYALSTTDFFSKAVFQGGTALRILYQLPRFSEDLDFILNTAESSFQWQEYIDQIFKVFTLYGIEPEITDRKQENTAVQKLFLKDNSIGKILKLNYQHHAHRKLLIKLEIDTNPPQGSAAAIRYLDFPIDYSIIAQDLPSNFSGKCHALLCRPYMKGRDWFDFAWYVSQRVTPNLLFFANAIKQTGPWAQQDLDISKTWLLGELEQKISRINWPQARLEVERFVNQPHDESLKLWSEDFFKQKLKVLADYI